MKFWKLPYISEVALPNKLKDCTIFYKKLKVSTDLLLFTFLAENFSKRFAPIFRSIIHTQAIKLRAFLLNFLRFDFLSKLFVNFDSE